MSGRRKPITRMMTRTQRMVDMGVAMVRAAEQQSESPPNSKNDDENLRDQETDTSSLFSQDSRDEYLPSSDTTSEDDSECYGKRDPHQRPQSKCGGSSPDKTAKSLEGECITSNKDDLSSPLGLNYNNVSSTIEGYTVLEYEESQERLTIMQNSDNKGHEPECFENMEVLEESVSHLNADEVCSGLQRSYSVQANLNELQPVSENTASNICNTVPNSRKWDKKYSCLYCKKLISKLPRHLRSAHRDEDLVRRWLSLPDDSEEKRKALNEIRNKGNFTYNIKVLTAEADDGVLITKKLQPKVLGRVDKKKYLPCEKCLGFFSRKYLYRHNKICGTATSKSKNNRNIQSRSAMLLPSSIVVDKAMTDNVLSKMVNDSVYEVLRNDSLIINYGKKLYKKHGHEKHLHQFVSQKMREIARFVQCAKDVDPNVKCLKDLIDQKYYKTCIEAVYALASFNPENNTFQIPSLALKTGHALKKCANILKGLHINQDNDNGIKTVENFVSYFSLNWTDDVSTHALRTMHERTWNAPKLLPLAEDVTKFYSYMKKRCNDLKTELIETPSKETWFKLAKVTLAHLVTFNRRRVGETQRLTVENYNKKQNATMDNDIKNSLSNMEIKLADSLQRIETRGKKGRGVAILLTGDMRNSIDILMQFRNIALIDPGNPFVFPARDSVECLRGCDVMREAASKAGLKKPNLVTSTRLRKHIGTMAQLLNLSKHELDLLARFMGHDIRIHRDFYRLTNDTLEMAKVSKILVAMEQGKISKFAGKSLDEIEVDVDEVVEEDPPSENEDAESPGELGKTINASETSMNKSAGQQEESGEHFPVRKITSIRKVSKKMPWTSNEKNCVMAFFSNEINLAIVPKKDKCLACIKQNPVLANRSWSQVKFCVYNKIQTNKGKKNN